MRPITTLFLAVAAIGSLALVGCGQREAPPPVAPGALPSGPTNDVPDWVIDPTLGGKQLAAYGVSEPMHAGEATMRTNAMINARQELAASIKTKIEAATKSWVREGGTIAAGENTQMAMTSFENTVRGIISHTLEGTQMTKRYIDPKTGKFYVLVVVNTEVVKQLAEAAKAAARENKELRAHFAAKIEADKAFDDLDKLIDKQLGTAK
ncbi:MAG: LPP20 family lipoprotein [Planctomycetota bacterium]